MTDEMQGNLGIWVSADFCSSIGLGRRYVTRLLFVMLFYRMTKNSNSNRPVNDGSISTDLFNGSFQRIFPTDFVNGSFQRIFSTFFFNGSFQWLVVKTDPSKRWLRRFGYAAAYLMRLAGFTVVVIGLTSYD